MDQELIAYLEERFRESSRQVMEGVRAEFGTIREEMGTFRQEMRGEMGTFREEMRGEMGTFRQEMREEVGTFRQEMREEVGTLRQEMREEVGTLRQEMVSRFEQVDEALRENRDEIRHTQENLRHTQIVMESMRSDIQGVAEGVLSTNQRLDALREEMQQGFEDVRHSTRLAYKDMDKRVLSLEEWRKRVGEDPAPRVRKKP